MYSHGREKCSDAGVDGRGGVKDGKGGSLQTGHGGLDCDSDRCLENCGEALLGSLHSPTLHLGGRGGIRSCHSKGLPPLAHPTGAWRRSPSDPSREIQVGLMHSIASAFFFFFSDLLFFFLQFQV